MVNRAYEKQFRLLLDVLPEVAKESCFALHGGTAINLFVLDMPRLSVDIDLTYVPIESRLPSLQHVGEALERIKRTIEATIPQVRVSHKQDIGKLLVSRQESSIKIEVNLIMRGTLSAPVKCQLCERAQSEFDAFADIAIVPLGQLYGGRICAALDRQHPRDLFDMKYLLANVGFSDEVKRGFLLCLLSSDRPVNEVIAPNFQDQRSALYNQFAGMTNQAFTYNDYEVVRTTLVQTIRESLTEEDKRFLLSVNDLKPDWSVYDFELFPAVQWKLRNLKALKETNPNKHRKQYEDLEAKLYQ